MTEDTIERRVNINGQKDSFYGFGAIFEAFQFFATFLAGYGLNLLLIAALSTVVTALPVLLERASDLTYILTPVSLLLQAILFALLSYKIACGTFQGHIMLSWERHRIVPYTILFVLYATLLPVLNLAAPLVSTVVVFLCIPVLIFISQVFLVLSAHAIDKRKTPPVSVMALLRGMLNRYFIYFLLTQLFLIIVMTFAMDLTGNWRMLVEASAILDTLILMVENILFLLVLSPIAYLSVQYLEYLKKIARQQPA